MASYIVISDVDGSSNPRRFDIDVERGTDQYNIVQSGEEIVKEFDLSGSMGETVCKHGRVCPGHYFSDFDSSDGTLRLPPAVTTSISNLAISYCPVSFWEAWDSDGDRAVYVIYRDTTNTPDVVSKKVRISDNTVVDTEIHSTAPARDVPMLGKVVSFEDEIVVPNGIVTGASYGFIKVMTAVGDISGGTADSWTADDVTAWSFALVQDESTTKIVRAIKGNYYTAATDPETAAGYSSAYEVGDNNTNAGVIWIVEGTDGLLYFARADNLYAGDSSGNAYPVLPFRRELVIKGQEDYDDVQGHMSAAVGDAILYPSTLGFDRYIPTARRSKNLSIDKIPGYRAVPNVSNIPIGLRHYAVVTFREHIYAIYKPEGATNSANVHIMYGEYIDGNILWRNLITRIKDILGLFIDSALRLWFIEDPEPAATSDGTATADFMYIQLANDGSPKTALGSNRGAASSTYEYYLGDVLFDQEVQFRYMKVETEGFDATTSLQLKIHRNEGTADTIGSAIVSDDYHVVPFTAGTTDTGYRGRMGMTLTTNGSYTPGSQDPRILRAMLVVRSPDLYRAVITNSTIDSARTTRKVLRQRKASGTVQVKEDWSGTQYKCSVVEVTDLETRQDKDGQMTYRTQVMIKRWDVEA